MVKSRNRSNIRRRGTKSRPSRSAESLVNVEIEQQLDRQRRKRALEGKSLHNEQQNPQMIGEYEYDPATKAYFPKGSCVKDQNPIEVVDDFDTSNVQPHGLMLQQHVVIHDKFPVRLIPTSAIQLVAETCSSPRRYRAIRSHWSGRIILSSMDVVASSIKEGQTPSKRIWKTMFSHMPQHVARPIGLPWDLVCKTSLHASSRTFDVQQATHDSSRFPDIATLCHGGLSCRLGYSTPRKCDLETLGFDSKCEDFPLRFTPRSTNDHPTLALLRPQIAFMTGVDPTVVTRPGFDFSQSNDIAFHPMFGRNNLAFAIAPQISSRQPSIMLHGDFDRPAQIKIKAKAFTKSDALCVEYLDTNLLLLGHRDGSISSCDTRINQIEVVATLCRDSGSTTSILPLTDGYSFLLKKSFGSCYMLDTRKISPTKETAVLHQLDLPSDRANPSVSSFCSGLAVDPTQTFAVSPFADNERRGHFALWSLTDGRFLGSKSCQNAMSERAPLDKVRTGMPFCELRSTITPSWHFESDQDGCLVVKRIQSSWSLWFKSGEVEPRAPERAGSIHQLTFSGNLDVL